MGYSGIAQAGYMLAGIVVASETGLEALVFYLAAYTLMNLAVFMVVVVRERETDRGDDIEALAGVGRTRPLLAWSLTIGMLALAGNFRGPCKALPDRSDRRRRLHVARRGDRDRDDGLPRLLPAGRRRRLDATRARRHAGADAAIAGGPGR